MRAIIGFLCGFAGLYLAMKGNQYHVAFLSLSLGLVIVDVLDRRDAQ